MKLFTFISYSWARYIHYFCLISALILFFHCMMGNFFAQMGKFLVELMNRLLHFRTQSINLNDELTRVMNPFFFFFLTFFLEKTIFDLSVFCSSKRDSAQLSYFWWNYFLNNFSLFDGLLRLVCLLIVHRYFIVIIDKHNDGTFSDETCSSTSVYILLHMDHQLIVSLQHFFLSFSSDFFTYRLTFLDQQNHH